MAMSAATRTMLHERRIQPPPLSEQAAVTKDNVSIQIMGVIIAPEQAAVTKDRFSGTFRLEDLRVLLAFSGSASAWGRKSWYWSLVDRCSN